VVGWPKAEPEEILIFRLQASQARQAPNLGRRPVVDFANRCIEAASAPKARGESDLAHRQLRLVDQVFREMQAPRLGYRTGRRSQMLDKQAAKMAGTDSQSFRESFDASVLEAALGDQAQCSGNGVRSSQPGGCSRGTLGAATQAGAISSFGCCRRAGKIATILLFRGRRRTDGTAVDAAASHADKKLPIEARIT